MASDRSAAVRQVYITNPGDGTLAGDERRRTGEVQATLAVGRQPVGIASGADGQVWIADGDDGSVELIESLLRQGPAIGSGRAAPGRAGQAHPRWPLPRAVVRRLRARPVFGQPWPGQDGREAEPVRELSVDGGVLAVAGVEPSLAYVTTSDDTLLYWDLTARIATTRSATTRSP